MTTRNEATYLHELSDEQLFESFIEVKLTKDDSFLIIKETLTRMGITNINTKSLYQTCHIFHKRGRYYITHFKELIRLDNRQVSMTYEDYLRRNAIAQKLVDWALVKPVKEIEPIPTGKIFDIIQWDDKSEWKLIPKHHIGIKRKY